MNKLSSKELNKLIKEVEILSSLDHPNIVKFHETYHDEQFFHIVMDLCSGKELLQTIISEGHLTETRVCRIIYKVLSAIAYCHNMKICHRDIKPENIIFESDQPDAEIKIIDFGLSTRYKNNAKMESILGTPYYIAPEVLLGKYNEKCDIWSIGAITYLTLTGEPPFNGITGRDIFHAIINKKLDYSKLTNYFSAESIDFLKKCLERDVNKRISAQEALNHNWFDLINKEIHSNDHLHVNVLNNLRKFTAPGELKKLALKFFVNNINQTELAMLKETFNAIDTEQDGYLKLSELEEGFKKVGIDVTDKELKNIFEKADFDKNGKVDYSEFLIAAMDQKQFLENENIISAFNHFDFDASGFIDIEDLQKDLLSTGHEVVHKEDLDNIISEVCLNEKRISVETFKALFGINN